MNLFHNIKNKRAVRPALLKKTNGVKLARKNAFIKISGDLFERPDVLEWIKKHIALKYYTVICVGGGTQINQAFKEKGYPLGKYSELGRSINMEDIKQQRLAHNILLDNQSRLQDLIHEIGVLANVVIPFENIGGVECHKNGDIMVFDAYHGFHKLYVFTLEERVATKKKIFVKFDKIEIVGFPEDPPA